MSSALDFLSPPKAGNKVGNTNFNPAPTGPPKAGFRGYNITSEPVPTAPPNGPVLCYPIGDRRAPAAPQPTPPAEPERRPPVRMIRLCPVHGLAEFGERFVEVASHPEILDDPRATILGRIARLPARCLQCHREEKGRRPVDRPAWLSE